ncbi:DIE2/ALG10 family protein [Coprinopsis cinerea okayama7|uniref:Dol-P-Glc:Glc(2)Man(9)GlcNAc(2)-PP-Dol alpha-1,2-glucosyltransferase n=1 Tax=Coprinopsis cinerea (strain Okayama-7 / 130 / ATCC MYA-4618 / FGSC 9003) TaxID=240176 RepID=D6RK09_COPC7|nr:DIE2/ALG10 family protein [Coprinopsis cinerea okayama7\|eukprot:XP_002912099.1 DIE2/ALG10 family protein [Coprinopsis cinerea okayama7\
MSPPYAVFATICVMVLKQVNLIVDEPYMVFTSHQITPADHDEPFHVPQAQAYCRGEFETWDPKITTPPGLYLMSLLLKKIFVFKCNLSMLRLTTMLALLALPLVLTRLLCYHKRIRPPTTWLSPSLEAVVLSFFPIAWFFGFLYYTEAPSLFTVALTVVAATQNRHWLAALFGLISCTFRQTNVIWMLYAYASSQVMMLRFKPPPKEGEPDKRLHDPPALHASLADIPRIVCDVPKIVPQILPAFIPYMFVLCAFAVFVIWNGGIVLGDKSNHVPTLHIPQLYYFFGFTTALGWPVLLSYSGGPRKLIGDVWKRMFGGKRQTLVSVIVMLLMVFTVKNFTIHHPFLLSDNRHYTFYVWRRVYLLHPAVPYLLVPAYLACAWAWYLRAGACFPAGVRSRLIQHVTSKRPDAVAEPALARVCGPNLASNSVVGTALLFDSVHPSPGAN